MTELQHRAATVSDRAARILRRSDRPASSWTLVIRLFLGLGWARACVAKSVRSEWWDGTDVEVFLRDHESATILWYRPIAQILESLSAPTAVVVLLLEVAIAVSFLTGRRMKSAVLIGVFLNLNFILVGAPNPSVFYLVMQVALGLWLVESLATSEEDLRTASYAVGVLTVIGLACLPFITTLQPGLVIEDPAAVVATAAFCALVAFLMARTSMRAGDDDQVVLVLD